jgi:glutathione S-transferase
MVKEAARWLEGLECQLEGREWITADDFSIADILLASVLREIRKTDLLDNYPLLKAYYQRALSRPAWQHTLESYADRLGVTVEAIL